MTEKYWSVRDPISAERLLWRAQAVRHTFHLLPGETILELACGSGRLTRSLRKVTRGECPITAATFGFGADDGVKELKRDVEVVALDSFPGDLRGRTFDYIVANNLLDLHNTAWLLKEVQRLLRPGGRLLFFETNPWNPMFQLRRIAAKCVPFAFHERALPSQVHLYELMSELGFVRIATTCYDFLYPPIPGWCMRVARNLSLVLENTPGVRNMAGTILVHAQRPPCDVPRPDVRMVEHTSLNDAISVVVPCHNEEMNAGSLVAGLLQHYDEYIHQIVLVDDNSTDGTRQVLEALAATDGRIRPVIRTPPGGVGLALRDGMRAATGKYILIMDCDFLQILPELRQMFDSAAEGFDVVLGSRFSRASVLINYPIQKILFNRTFHLLASLLFRRRLRDLTNNLKLLKREVADNLNLESFLFAANAETGLKPLLMGYSMDPVPISWINRTSDMGQSSFSLLTNGWGYTKVLASLAWSTRCGRRPLARPSEASKSLGDRRNE
ncbi:MAG TPA: glycosyltransferase [Vicinamibacterales bacterium]|nr:glycosyltransferase [Vicinamibacterales bacterium]